MGLSETDIQEERVLLGALQKKHIKAFIQLYKTYSEDLLIFAYCYLNDRILAIQAVEAFFEYLWEHADFADIDPPIYPVLLAKFKRIFEEKFGTYE